VIRDRLTRDRVIRDRVTRDRVTRDRVTRDHVTRDHVTRDRLARDRLTRDRLTRDRLTRDRLTRDRLTGARPRAPRWRRCRGLPHMGAMTSQSPARGPMVMLGASPYCSYWPGCCPWLGGGSGAAKGFATPLLLVGVFAGYAVLRAARAEPDDQPRPATPPRPAASTPPAAGPAGAGGLRRLPVRRRRLPGRPR